MNVTRRICLLAVIGSALLGCQSSRSGVVVDVAEIRRGMTKHEVLGLLGVPSQVNRDFGGEVLSYSAASGDGLAAGVAYSGARLLFEHVHVKSDVVQVVLDSSGRVQEVRPAPYTGDVLYTCWPFGD